MVRARELRGRAAIGQARRRIDPAAHRRDARSDRAGGGPFRRGLEGTDVGNVGSGRADETLVFGVDEADRPVEADARAGAGEVAGEHGVRLGLEPLEAGLGGVGGDAAETLHPADETTDRAGRSEEHTSELQSLMRISYAVFCLKKKKS